MFGTSKLLFCNTLLRVLIKHKRGLYAVFGYGFCEISPKTCIENIAVGGSRTILAEQ